ncbi:TIGR01457 family HAD-type hydrolase [Tuberibacillus sp. Marseille-P3662]|uniref:TIGR01457 family HAD-type hydrolase n=1 Tax=Tuberibacillus sp. Marseille-P3662 TaxID=1965358 RepID=UPI000A1C8E76|nr:TIGR01457 family HAD-type hydrolase [Tuberibacillus sp. Marseille-P3662]
MKPYKAYLIDLDGTVYKGTEPINEAIDFVKTLHERGETYLFVTNNATRTKEQVSEKLVNMGAPATPDQVLTTSMAAAQYIQTRTPGASVYFIGEAGLETALIDAGLSFEEDVPDYVVIGLDRHVNYEKLAKASLAVRNGATFISTNPDEVILTERGFLPGNGAITSVVSSATHTDPIFIGKPEAIIVEQALEKLGVAKNEAIMIGDNYHTDILAGINAGVDTLMLHTGVTTREELTNVEEQPSYVMDSLSEWLF